MPLVPQGGNTGMAAGATPPADGSALLLSMRRMNRIRSISAENRLAVAEAGVILATLHDAAHEIGMRFPLTLGSRGSCTIGGLTSTNAGGTQVLKFGTMRALVAGVEAVLPDGSIHNGLSGLKKDNRGYSLDQLLIGAEGTLGVVTAVALRLVPAIAARAVAWAGVESPARALDLLRFLEARTNSVEGFELVPEDSLDLVLQAHPGHPRAAVGRSMPGMRWSKRRPPTPITTSAAELERLLAAALQAGHHRRRRARRQRSAGRSLLEAPRHHFGGRARRRPDARARHLRRGRRHAALHRRGRGARSSAPSRASSPAASAISATATSTSTSAPAATPRPIGTSAKATAITRMVDDLVTAAGGSISAEHGIGQLKRDEFARLAPPGRIHALRAIKQALDPLGIMNPGKLRFRDRLARPAGFEPATSSLEGSCSIQLSYGRAWREELTAIDAKRNRASVLRMKPRGSGCEHVEARALHGARFRYFDFVMVAFVVVLLLSNVIGAEKRSFVDLPGIGAVAVRRGHPVLPDLLRHR